MEVHLEKLSVIDQILKVSDAQIISKIKAILKDQVVGYDADNQAITQSLLENEILASRERMKRGDYTTQEALEKEIKGWK